MRRPCRQLFFWTPRTCVLQCLVSWAIKNVVFSYVWGVMAPMGKLVTCLGRLGRQNRIKGSRRVRPCRRSGIRSVPNLWFSSVCYAWANKTWCFAMVDGSGRSTAVVKPHSRPLAHQITTLGAPLLWSSHIRDPWRIKSPLWALHCCGQAIFETHGASNHKLLLTSGDQVQHKSCVFSELGSRSFKSYVFSDARIHHTALTSKSKEQRRE